MLINYAPMKASLEKFKKYLKLSGESFVFAYHAVIVNRLRTILSLLGITIGIFTIISVFTVIDSLTNNIRNSVNSLGSDMIYVMKWPWTFGADYPWWEYMKRPVARYSEYEEVSRRSNYAAATCFYASTSKTIKYLGNSMDNVNIWLATQEFPSVRAFELEKGRFFTAHESAAGTSIAIIGNEIATQLFKNTDPLNKDLVLSGRRVTVVGVVTREGHDDNGFGSFDNAVLIPMNYGRTIYDVKDESLNPTIMVKAKPNALTDDLIEELRMIMRAQRRIAPKEKDNFALNKASMFNLILEPIFRILNIAGWLIGGFSILVGGFGVANIMFVSVKERTNIIGIQKAMGAKRFFILYQFLFESVLLALTGGFIGLIMVFIGTLIVTYGLDFKISLTLGNIMLGIFISSIIGIIAGYVPALSASRLDPVKAIATTF